jgi:hypothetical protein
MSDAILVLNSGSSSIKFALFDLSSNEPVLLCKGLLDEHVAEPRLVVTDSSGHDLFEKHRPAADSNGDALLADILDWSDDYLAGGALVAVGHRVVHGARDFTDAVEVSDATLAALAALTPLAPLHQPGCLSPIRTIKSLRPGLKQIACFDTAFHHGLGLSAALRSRGASKRSASAATAFTGFPLNSSRAASPRSRLRWPPAARSWRISVMEPAFARCATAEASTPRWASRRSTD